MGDSIVLVGPRCVGKTSVGKDLVSRLQLTFVDGDHIFENKNGSIDKYVAVNGWPAFREEETRIIIDLCAGYRTDKIILTPGGGAVAHQAADGADEDICRRMDDLRQTNVEQLRDFGKIFYLIPYDDLNRSAAVLAERLEADNQNSSLRPALTEASDAYVEMRKVLHQRNRLYLKAAHHPVYTKDNNPRQIADDICRILSK